MNNRIVKEISGVILIALATFIALSLYSFKVNPEAVTVIKAGVSSAGKSYSAGPAGIFITQILATSLGLSSFLLMILLFFIGWFLIRDKKLEVYIASSSAIAILIPSVSTFLHLTFNKDPFFQHDYQSGGLLGYFISTFFVENFGILGSYLILCTLIFISFLLFTKLSLHETVDFLKDTANESVSKGKSAWVERKRKISEKKTELARKEKIKKVTEGPKENIIVEQPKEKEKKKLLDLSIISRKKKKAVQQEFEFVNEIGEYNLPPLKLLTTPEAPPITTDEQKKLLMSNAALLETKLLDFGIEGRVLQIMPGPVVTTYEFEPAPGVKVSKIANLSDDLAMAMKAMSIRVLAPIPGKSVIGIEIPNEVRENIVLKEIIGDEIFQKLDSK
ncbi:MAG: DNA translocase FtsK 4TM domain-containing protein, partial [Nitrospinae bacterium]|nr:DNA translocase FtsK 4TM domain-containing protein [Nitrospinota bacterium]